MRTYKVARQPDGRWEAFAQFTEVVMERQHDRKTGALITEPVLDASGKPIIDDAGRPVVTPKLGPRTKNQSPSLGVFATKAEAEARVEEQRAIDSPPPSEPPPADIKPAPKKAKK